MKSPLIFNFLKCTVNNLVLFGLTQSISLTKLFGDNLKAVLFYEEEIKNGGMGMTLSTILKDDLKARNIEYNILAINDNFAATSKEGQNAYQMAGVDCLYAEKELRSMLDITPNNE